MEIAYQDTQYLLRNEHRQLIDKDNVFVKTKNIISDTSNITMNYIAASYILSGVLGVMTLLYLGDEPKSKHIDLSYNKLKKLRVTLVSLLKTSEERCLEAWENVFLKSPDLVQQYFFDSELKIDNANIGVVLKEILYHVLEAVDVEKILKSNSLQEFFYGMKKMLIDVYEL